MEDTDKLNIVISGEAAKWMRRYKRSMSLGKDRKVFWQETIEHLQMEMESLHEAVEGDDPPKVPQ